MAHNHTNRPTAKDKADHTFSCTEAPTLYQVTERPSIVRICSTSLYGVMLIANHFLITKNQGHTITRPLIQAYSINEGICTTVYDYTLDL